ncbi:MAG TPA: hypothetical protein VMT35_04195 [Ignavibacteriaceae bacterium]|nr:hypothetical protein [Ignavibacteriaceae bacterium]
MSASILKYIFISAVVLLCFSSCREEIIPPFTPAGNINEPIQQVTAGSYSFTINAQSISDSLIDHTLFKSSRSHLNLSLFDYLSGSIELTIYDRRGNVIYNSFLSKNFQSSSLVLQGSVPDVVQIFFNRFTGKLAVQLFEDMN